MFCLNITTQNLLGGKSNFLVHISHKKLNTRQIKQIVYSTSGRQKYTANELSRSRGHERPVTGRRIHSAHIGEQRETRARRIKKKKLEIGRASCRERVCMLV